MQTERSSDSKNNFTPRKALFKQTSVTDGVTRTEFSDDSADEVQQLYEIAELYETQHQNTESTLI